jgi:hypothetical protein
MDTWTRCKHKIQQQGPAKSFPKLAHLLLPFFCLKDDFAASKHK